MNKIKLWCFGDSNTYGYDPCNFFGGCYAAPWPVLLEEKTGFEVINDGMNGRMIPRREYELRQFHRDMERYAADLLVIMLGTNDLLEGANAVQAASRMESFLSGRIVPRAILVCPPPLKRGAWVPDDKLVEESQELARLYKVLAERLGLPYADAGGWDIDLAGDGVHFSEKGHLCFANGIAEYLSGMGYKRSL